MIGNHYDVIIVGGGPAGGTAAFHLRRAGKKVLVIEKETLPRYKTCGGGLSIEFLKRQFPFSLDSIVELDANEISYAYRTRKVTIPIQSGRIGMVMRAELDAAILSSAKAEILQGCSVTCVKEGPDCVQIEIHDGRVFTSDYLIGADGANSIVARGIGLRPKRMLMAAIEAEVNTPDVIFQKYGRGPLFIFGEIHFGYLWIFPKSDHLSVGIAALHPKRSSLANTLKQVMSRYGISLDGIEIHGHPIPIYSRSEPISTKRVLLVGDAAGLVDPLSGEGIRYAIKSGKIASEAIISENLANYTDLIHKEIRTNHRLAGITAQIFYRMQFLCITLGAPNPFTTQVIIDLLADRAKTIDVMLFSIITLPIYWISEITARLVGLFGGKKLGNEIRARLYQGFR